MTDVPTSAEHVEQPLSQDDRRAAAEIAAARDRIVAQLEKVIVGQKPVIEELLIALFSRGHCLLVGVPGLAKTLLISTLASVLTSPSTACSSRQT
jgi:MoxR-like ATPase